MGTHSTELQIPVAAYTCVRKKQEYKEDTGILLRYEFAYRIIANKLGRVASHEWLYPHPKTWRKSCCGCYSVSICISGHMDRFLPHLQTCIHRALPGYSNEGGQVEDWSRQSQCHHSPHIYSVVKFTSEE